MKISTNQNKPKGFTLVELIISMAVTMVIIGVLMAMTRVAVKGMTSAQNATRYSRIAQDVMSTMTKDLEGIVIRSGNDYEWVNVSVSDASGTELGPSSEMKNPIEISFFSAVTDRYDGEIGTNDDKGGDISLVRYKLVHQDVIGGNYPVFSLYRKRVDPDVTFTSHLAKQALTKFTDTVTGNDFLAENVFDMTVSFNFELYKDDGTTVYRRVPVQISGVDKTLSIKGNEVLVNGSTLVVGDADSARLASADISILVLSDKGMKGVDKANLSTTAKLSEYLKKHGKHFSKSVVLPRP